MEKAGTAAARVMAGLDAKTRDRSETSSQAQSSRAEDHKLCVKCGMMLEYNLLEFAKPGRRMTCLSCQEKENDEERRARIENRKVEAEKFDSELGLKVSRWMHALGVPKRNMDNSVESFIGKTPEKRPGIITGPTGTGKTHLAIGFMRREIERRFAAKKFDHVFDVEASLEYYEHALEWAARSTCFVSALEFVWEMRKAVRTNTDDEVMRKYSEVEFLVLDDFGAERPTEWSTECLGKLIYTRHAEVRDTLVTSNMSLQEIGSEFNNRIMSRIAEFGDWVQLFGKNRRLEGVQCAQQKEGR